MTHTHYEFYKQLAWETGEDLEVIESYGFEMFDPPRKNRKANRRRRTRRDTPKDFHQKRNNNYFYDHDHNTDTT